MNKAFEQYFGNINNARSSGISNFSKSSDEETPEKIVSNFLKERNKLSATIKGLSSNRITDSILNLLHKLAEENGHLSDTGVENHLTKEQRDYLNANEITNFSGITNGKLHKGLSYVCYPGSDEVHLGFNTKSEAVDYINQENEENKKDSNFEQYSYSDIKTGEYLISKGISNFSAKPVALEDIHKDKWYNTKPVESIGSKVKHTIVSTHHLTEDEAREHAKAIQNLHNAKIVPVKGEMIHKDSDSYSIHNFSTPKFKHGDKVKLIKEHPEFGTVSGTLRIHENGSMMLDHDRKDPDGTTYSTKVDHSEIIHNFSTSEESNKELELGIKRELEHTSDSEVAKKIAIDHLKETPEYYTKLEKCIPESGKETNFSNPVSISPAKDTKMVETIKDIEKSTVSREKKDELIRKVLKDNEVRIEDTKNFSKSIHPDKHYVVKSTSEDSKEPETIHTEHDSHSEAHSHMELCDKTKPHLFWDVKSGKRLLDEGVSNFSCDNEEVHPDNDCFKSGVDLAKSKPGLSDEELDAECYKLKADPKNFKFGYHSIEQTTNFSTRFDGLSITDHLVNSTESEEDLKDLKKYINSKLKEVNKRTARGSGDGTNNRLASSELYYHLKKVTDKLENFKTGKIINKCDVNFSHTVDSTKWYNYDGVSKVEGPYDTEDEAESKLPKSEEDPFVSVLGEVLIDDEILNFSTK